MPKIIETKPAFSTSFGDFICPSRSTELPKEAFLINIISIIKRIKTISIKSFSLGGLLILIINLFIVYLVLYCG